MLICGIKLSHDGGVAVLDGGNLVFSIEAEKLRNNLRYSSLERWESITEILRAESISFADVDSFVIDGWWPEAGTTFTSVHSTVHGQPVSVQVAPYLDDGARRPCLMRYSFVARNVGPGEFSYSSYHHATGHLLASYCTSPFAKRGEDAMILVWDGSMTPRLYEVGFADLSVRPAGPLTVITGNTFANVARHFEPFYADSSGWDDDRDLRYHLGVAGKAMAYAALGTVQEDLFEYFDNFFDSLADVNRENGNVLGQQLLADRNTRLRGLSNADIIATLQDYLGIRLLAALKAAVSRSRTNGPINLGIAGGCGLNIKWNSLLRQSGLFREIWVPPFPNDSGAAIGVAAAEMFVLERRPALDWDVYRGPRLVHNSMADGWLPSPCDERQLAEILHLTGEPVIVLSGRSELGPRALGNRSILAPATDKKMKDRLNEIKSRESYRPVAPICLESRAAEIFDPGMADPYMLFEHRVRPAWLPLIPAVIHLDGTARLQTVNADDCAAGRILREYARLSGIPVLCNTSANFSGKGFFPDVASASRWGGTRYIWSDGTLLTRPSGDQA